MSHQHEELIRQAQKLVEDLARSPEDVEAITARFNKKLKSHVKEQEEFFCDSWQYEDIRWYLKDNHPELDPPFSPEEFHRVADLCERKNSSNMSHEILSFWIEEVLEERES